MRFSNVALAASVAGSAAAQSICDKYTTALLMDNTPANQYTLVTLLVKTAVLGNFTGNGTANPTLPGSMVNVPGILAAGEVDGTAVDLLPYFNGSLLSTNRDDMPVSVNFLDGGEVSDLINDPSAVGADGSNQATLFAHLVSYFGVLLGCSGYGEDNFPAYQGSNSQYNVHKYMALSAAEFTYFIQQVGLSAQSFGAVDEDIMAAATALNSTFGARCAPAAAVVPDSDEEAQVICAGEGCPLATDAVADCTGEAAFPGFTPSAAATADASMTDSASMTMTDSASMTMTDSASMTMTESESMMGTSSMPTATGANAPSSTAPNAAARQTAAGLFAAAGLAAAALL